ncbi:MAG: DNA-deoxyinosine glycosylase [Candidatus Polarisedimenticolaceae bacterium]|nr:DNA-deoxyinosine glycosylase [Candidatus Polarisedimenticolaceae bacterium]
MKESFSSVAMADAKIVILGSMPGDESLRQQQYYAHPRNAFWYILQRHFNRSESLTYQQKIELSQHYGIALWDVMQRCERPGSLDSNIDNKTIVVNEFEVFFRLHKNLVAVLFNGAKAEQEYRKRVLPTLSVESRRLELIRLPSTSPAMAALNREQKYLVWCEVLTRFV